MYSSLLVVTVPKEKNQKWYVVINDSKNSIILNSVRIDGEIIAIANSVNEALDCVKNIGE